MKKHPGQSPASKMFPALAVLLLTAVGAFFRFYDLGLSALRADTITFWKICNQDMTWAEIASNWTKMGHTGHFPFANAFIKWFLDVFQIEPTFTTIRIPSALWGTLAVPVAFGLGRAIRGNAFGYLLAALVVLNPYHIQFAREAYFYPPMMLGSFVLLWAAVLAFKAVHLQQPLGRGFPWIAGSGVFLLIYSLPGGWLLYLIVLPMLIGLLVVQKKGNKVIDPRLKQGVIVSSLLMVPFFFASWGFKQFGSHVGGGAVRAAGEKAREATTDTVWTMLSELFTAYGWGSTTLRLGFGVLVGVAAVVCLVRAWKSEKVLRLVPIIFLVGLVLFIGARKGGGMLFQARYMLPFLPVYLVFMGLGLVELGALLRIPKKLQVLVPALGLAFLLQPAVLSTQLTGRPTPYLELVSEIDRTLDAGSVVLVDSWLEATNELAVHPSTNVYFTFILPNEPLDQFKAINWRATAEEFFEEFPQGAYLEIAKTFWEVPEIGPWEWPRSHFARHFAVTNEAGLKLRGMGLAARGDFYTPNTNRVICEIFYNTRADLIEKAKREGKQTLLLCGDGWKFFKGQDFGNYRVLEEGATLDFYNLTVGPLDVVLEVEAMGLRSAKKIVIGRSVQHLFPPGRPAAMRTGVFTIPPGRNTVVFKDPDWPRIQNPLMVRRIRLLTKAEIELAGPSVQS